jgi:hypothetical protein
MTASAAAETPGQPDGTVTGMPRRWLRLEGAVLLAGSLIAYSATGQPWWLVPLTLLAPDLVMVGYLHDTRLGAQLYNLAHATVLPAAMVGLGWWQSRPLVLALGLIWLAHIGIDRLVGYGLKYGDHFQHTHLGHLGQPTRASDQALHPARRRAGRRPGPVSAKNTVRVERLRAASTRSDDRPSNKTGEVNG